MLLTFQEIVNMLRQSLALASCCLAAVSAFPFPFSKRALYITDNDPTGNHVNAAKISSETGLLSDSVIVPTGGKGLYGTMSQDSVVVAEDVSKSKAYRVQMSLTFGSISL